jgi:hypothetical protein
MLDAALNDARVVITCVNARNREIAEGLRFRVAAVFPMLHKGSDEPGPYK